MNLNIYTTQPSSLRASSHTSRTSAQTPPRFSLRRCVLLALGAQAASASTSLTFATADRRMQGVLKTDSTAHIEFEPETMDPLRLFEAIAPCGPFDLVSLRRLGQTPPQTETLVPVRHLPPAYHIALLGANQSTHHCVRAASWDAARYAGGELVSVHHGVYVGLGFALVLAGGHLAERLNGRQRPLA